MGLGVDKFSDFIFLAFAFSSHRPNETGSRSVLFQPLLVMFNELYGFSFTIYLLSGWLQSPFPETDILAHDSGHL
jgi:hypothetical protein